MAKLYANENFPLPVVEVLRRLGHDVVTIQEMGLGGEAVPDFEVLRFAAAEDRAVVTLNRRHFIRLHNEPMEHAGIIVCTADADHARQANRIHHEIEKRSDLHGELIRVDRPAR